MKLLSNDGLYSLLYAAYTYASYQSPSERINEYLVVNNIVPPNIRRDSQLSDIWRDYQQILPELGFMYSTTVTGGLIQPTPCGLFLLDNKQKFQEILTSQVLLYQYPNGGKREYAEDQIANGVLIRPAVLVWRVIGLIKLKGGSPYLTSFEIRDYLMHCCTHFDAEACAMAILNFRKTGNGLQKNALGNSGRNSTDWITLLTNTLLFKLEVGKGKALVLSEYSRDNFIELDALMGSLEAKGSFWNPSFIDNAIRKEWYAFYGALRVDATIPNSTPADDYIEAEDKSSPREENFGKIKDVDLISFNPTRLNYNHENRERIGRTIESSYDADMVANKHRLHDTMVIYIANICSEKNAEVFEDPNSIDLFVKYLNTEYIIEVKTITPNNYIKRLRYAIGQLLYYDFMLEKELKTRRKILAFPSILPTASNFLPFFNNHLDIDILSLVPSSDGQIIQCNSNHTETINLFSISN